MARLPTPGSDDGTWGTVLNDFLAQAHDSDGTLKAGAVDTTAVTDGTITEAKLSSAVQTKLNSSAAVTSVNTQTGAVVLDADDISDSTATNKYVTAAEKTKLSNLSGTNTGDQTSVTGNAGTATKLATARNINGVAFDGTANITVADATKVPTSTTVNGHALSSNVTVTASDVSLGNVDNTSDANKPVSTAQQTALNGKANTVHTHIATDISDFDEATQDVVGAAIVAGSNISVNYNDTAGTITIAATASGGTNATNLSTNTDGTTVTIMSDTGSDAIISSADASNAGALTAADKVKLDGVATGATANSSNATLLNRANHTGTQTASTISDFSSTADARVAAAVGSSVEAHDTDLTTIAGLTPTNDDIIQRKAGAWTNRTVAQYKTDLALSKSDVGLGNVDNTSDATKNSASVTLTNKTISGASNTISGIAESSVTNLTTDLSNKLDVKNSNPQLTNSTTDKFSRVDITDDASATSGWPDRFAFYFSGTRTGYHNEYGELRARPAKTNTVPLRAMGHASGSTVNLFEVAPSASGTEYFAVSTTAATLSVPLTSTSTIAATNIGAKVTASSSAPGSPATGDVWIDLSA